MKLIATIIICLSMLAGCATTSNVNTTDTV